MNTLELEKFFRKYNHGAIEIVVCAIDELPLERLANGKSYGYVVNLSRKHEPGSHWISIFIDRGRHGYYLDSYGFKERSWYLSAFLKNNCRTVTYNERQLQQLQSNVCGMYAACFIVHWFSGYSFNHFLAKFSKNPVINDQFIVKIFNYYRRN